VLSCSHLVKLLVVITLVSRCLCGCCAATQHYAEYGLGQVCCNCIVSHRAAHDANSTVLLGLFSVAAAIPLLALVCAKQICASALRSLRMQSLTSGQTFANTQPEFVWFCMIFTNLHGHFVSLCLFYYFGDIDLSVAVV